MEYQNVDNVVIQPMRVILGDNTMLVQKITCRADVAGDLTSKHFVLHTPTENHVFWFDDGVVTDPTFPTGWVVHPIVFADDDSATSIATKVAAVIAALTGKFTATASGKVVTVTNTAAGYAHAGRDAYEEAKRCGFAFKITTLGFAEVSAGAIKDDIEISGMTSKSKEILTHATGETVQGEIITGYDKPTLKLNFYEFNKAAIKRALILAGGQTMLPELEDATEIIGYGQTSLGSAKPTIKVRLHKVDADDADMSEDWNIWKASVSVDSFKFSGTDFSEIPVSIAIYPDTTKPGLIQFFAIGDVTGL